MYFHRNRCHIGLLNHILTPHPYSVFVGGIQQEGGRRVDQVKHRAQVDRKAFLALAYKHLALVFASGATGNGNGVDVLAGIRGVSGGIAQRLHADVVNRLLKGRTATGFGDGGNRAFAAFTAHDVDRIGFVDVQIGVIQGADCTRLNQRNRHAGGANLQRN